MSKRSGRVTPLVFHSPRVTDSDSDATSPGSPLSPSAVDSAVDNDGDVKVRDGERRDRDFLQALKGLLKVYRYGKADRDRVMAATSTAFGGPHLSDTRAASIMSSRPALERTDAILPGCIEPVSMASIPEAQSRVFVIVCQRYGDEIRGFPDLHPVFLTLEAAQTYVGSLYLARRHEMNRQKRFELLFAQVVGEHYLDFSTEYGPNSNLDVINDIYKTEKNHINLYIFPTPFPS
jgi:hypothetical protein